MNEKLRAFWHGPVWSKVVGTIIAAAILAVAATAWDKYKPGAANVFRMGVAVPFWFLIALVLGTFIFSVLIFSRRLRQSPKITTADHKLTILSASYGKSASTQGFFLLFLTGPLFDFSCLPTSMQRL